MKFIANSIRPFFLAVAGVMLCASAHAESAFPGRPVKIVVPFAAGGSSDSAARILAERLSRKWKQPVIVDNRPGANALIGASLVAKAPADGYTLLLAPVSMGTINIFVKQPGFSPERDLIPISQVAQGDYVLTVSKDLPVKSMGEFAAYARSHPGKVFHGAFGGASMLAFEQFSSQMQFKAQNVNYRGESLALGDLMAGNVQAVFATLMGAKPLIDSGRIRALGVPSKVRAAIAPDIPAADESGAKGFYVDYWFGLMAPAGTPHDVVGRIGAAVADVLGQADVKAKLHAHGLTARASSPEEFGKLIRLENVRWTAVAKQAGIEPQ
ncbi:tripartite tricarboxylate transporter substrate binding protein [Cupriavidus sp. L7L]|uniref:Bug family tripartite tricarboxylate transporter substrate binding protein n=1 Tax=Cupriavidus sp. L7L TaxID=2546443 RepID=UPI0010553A3D|nr:tripartite tricarboxylate transporter substrate binding protein [Cupriavidus sp. L7L]TDF64967.1 tripartite tricarboxylate transporter substrate binding protein [Cupriavidus sp. L7L]